MPWPRLARLIWRSLVVLALAFAGARVGGSSEATPPASAKHFDVTVSRYKFEPETLEVTEGDQVSVTVHSLDTTHGFAIKKLKVKKVVPKDGSPVEVEFVAAEPGTYEIACSEYCGSGHRSMKARLVVLPKSETAGK